MVILWFIKMVASSTGNNLLIINVFLIIKTLIHIEMVHVSTFFLKNGGRHAPA